MRHRDRELARLTQALHVAAQGSSKQVERYVRSLSSPEEGGAEDLLRDFKRARR